MSGLVVYTGPHCPPVCPGVFVRIFGASVLDDAVYWVGRPPKHHRDAGKGVLPPHGKMTVDSLACLRRSKNP